MYLHAVCMHTQGKHACVWGILGNWGIQVFGYASRECTNIQDRVLEYYTLCSAFLVLPVNVRAYKIGYTLGLCRSFLGSFRPVYRYAVCVCVCIRVCVFVRAIMATPYTGLFIAASCNSWSSHSQVHLFTK
jgi:hypothetical protein